jgi:hypothetical protein
MIAYMDITVEHKGTWNIQSHAHQRNTEIAALYKAYEEENIKNETKVIKGMTFD